MAEKRNDGDVFKYVLEDISFYYKQKNQEGPLPEEAPAEIPIEPADKGKEMPPKPDAVPDKTTATVVLPTVTPTPVAPRLSAPIFSKTSPNDLYRRLLPAMLFVLTFVTVMTMLLIYMDTVALGAQKFRANMSRDYELARIAQGSAALVAFVQQLHLAPAHRPAPRQRPPQPTPQLALMDRLYGEIYNGTFVEFLPHGPRDQTTLYLERARQWDGVVVRAAARDYLALRGNTRALHACLSPTAHPREVTYQEAEGGEALFRSRVLCLPLLTVLLAADAARAQYLLLAGAALPALQHLPFHEPRLRLPVIEVQFTNDSVRNQTSDFLLSKNYTVAASFDNSVMYTLAPGL